MRLLLMFLSCLLMVLCCGCNQADKANGHYNYINNSQQITLAGYRHLAPGERDGLYCSKFLCVWESLITNDEYGRPAPSLAKSWEMHAGGREWIFHLREDVKFHNGVPFNADAVIANLARMELGYKPSFYGLNFKVYYPSILSYEKLDEYTVKLTFAKPAINQLYKMMNFGSPMYAPDGFTEDGNFKGIAMGTGPYKIKENVLGEYVKLERNEDYYGEKAHIPEIVVRKIPDMDVRYAALKAGEIMGLIDLEAISPFQAEELRKGKDFSVSSSKSTITRFLHVNGSKFPFNDVRMRQAVSLAIDREGLLAALYMNYAVPTTNILNYTSPYHKPLPVEHDLEKAKRLAAEVLQGQTCPIIYCINGSDPIQKGEAELIAYWLKPLGLEVTIKAMERGNLSYSLRKGEYDIARSRMGLPNGDPYSIFYKIMMADGALNKSTCSGYANQEVAELLEKVNYIEDEEQRCAIYDRIQEIGAEELPIIPLCNDKIIVAYSNHLKNYHALMYSVDLPKIEWQE